MNKTEKIELEAKLRFIADYLSDKNDSSITIGEMEQLVKTTIEELRMMRFR